MKLETKALIVEDFIANGKQIIEISETMGIQREVIARIISLYFNRDLKFASTSSRYETFKKIEEATKNNLTISYEPKDYHFN